MAAGTPGAPGGPPGWSIDRSPSGGGACSPEEALLWSGTVRCGSGGGGAVAAPAAAAAAAAGAGAGAGAAASGEADTSIEAALRAAGWHAASPLEAAVEWMRFDFEYAAR